MLLRAEQSAPGPLGPRQAPEAGGQQVQCAAVTGQGRGASSEHAPGPFQGWQVQGEGLLQSLAVRPALPRRSYVRSVRMAGALG